MRRIRPHASRTGSTGDGLAAVEFYIYIIFVRLEVIVEHLVLPQMST